ncbi:MAG: flagellar hook-basal body complex protein FliE [Deltaproteobacteria bacterium]|nr:flagellar hook-basal body complex protein FliE [Candidatus Anaeroferrophillus wilburensis]MBN2888482.1 flagellar hook-basal body complex protein FliE [Deltaproteobacteria bacterium]
MKKSAMQAQLQSLQNLARQAAGPFGKTAEQPAGGAASFSSVLQQSLGKVNTLQQQADTQVAQVHSGQSADLISAIVALEEADMSFQLLLQVRNKAVKAYDEIMRMQL